MFDVDDTICESTKPITAGMAKVLGSLIDKGFLLVFSSGSKADQVYNQLHPILNNKYWIIGTSGSVCEFIDRGIRRTMFKAEIPIEDREKILAVLNEVVEKFGIQTLTTKDDQIQDRESQVTLSCIGRSAPHDLKINFDPDKSKRRVWVEYIVNKLGDEYNITMGGTTSIDITLKGMNKATGAKQWLESASLDKKQVIFFGDQMNEGGNDSCMKDLVDCIQVQNPMDTMNILEYMDMIFFKG
jgi:hypothetical protein